MADEHATYVLSDSVTQPDREAWFALPAGFTTLPLDALTAQSDTTDASRLREVVDDLLAGVPDGVGRQRVIGQLAGAQRMMLALREEGVVHCSLGLHRDDDGDGRLLTSFFTFRWQEISRAPLHLTAARAVAAGHDRIEVLDLPCGPAAIGEAAMRVAPDLGIAVERLLQIHAYLPHPDGSRLAVLTLTTPAPHRRAHYRAMLHDVAEHVSFDDPLVHLRTHV
ncbi:hypothetical protein [Streptomyces sp. CMB-StM0423]|uniref:hypothetical protein n=1 Tax=Streptomyces sp. CMB-StM0423 TaxID=2059884 RepID=UPI000C712687|nr:hypothetical protein [Streptomyces sp. CMB-StM0423]AUH42659.1 hypothetical protein CXR04_22960 [Streptomyces sp. CMB-StM0423]